MSNAERLSELAIDRSDAPNRRPLLTWTLIVVALLPVAAAGAWLWLRGGAVAVDLAAAQPVTGNTLQPDAVLDGTGYVTARRQATVSAKTTAKVMEVLIEEGMRVEEGQVLARLDDSVPRAQLELSRAQLAAARSGLREIEVDLADAQRTLRRSRELIDRKLVSQEVVDQADARVQALNARLAARREDVSVAQRSVTLQEQLVDDMTVRAPFAGMVIAKAAQPGEMISPITAGGGFTRTGIGTLVDMDSLEIEVDVNEAYIERVAADQPVVARLDAYPDWEIAARVIAIIPAADRQKATVPVRIAFLQRDPRILPDMGVQVSFQATGGGATDQAASPANLGVIIPHAATRREGEKTIVYAVRDGAAQRRAITVGDRKGDHVIVRGGLSAGDRVISPLPETISDGVAVKTAP